MSPRYSVIAVEADADPGDQVPFPAGCDGAFGVVRRDGVPVGSLLVHGPPPRAMGELMAQAVLRPDEPPPAIDGRLRLCVAVCTKDRPDLLARCLESVRSSLEAAGTEVDGDIVVVDNASGDRRTRDVAESAGAVCVREEVPGLDVARNAAVSAATGDVLAFVDDDVVVDRMWARTLARAFAARPDAVAVTGQVRALRFDTAAQIEFERTGGFSLGWEPIDFVVGSMPDVPFGRAMGAGCNMAFRTSLLDQLGPFDEALDTGRPLPGGGDLDILVRSVLVGPVLYEPSALVFHDHRTDLAALRYQFYSWGKGYAVLLAKWYRQSPDLRPTIRSDGWRRWRSYLANIVKDRHSHGGHRRIDAAYMAVGFGAGLAGSYRRSQRRMVKRRAVVAASRSAAT